MSQNYETVPFILRSSMSWLAGGNIETQLAQNSKVVDALDLVLAVKCNGRYLLMF